MQEGAQYIKVNRLELILYQSFLSNPFSKADRHAANTLYWLHVRLLLTYNVSQRLTLPLPQSEIAADWILHPTYSDAPNHGGVPRQLSNWQSVIGCSSAWDLDICLMRQIQCRGRGETPDAEAVNHFCFEVLKFKTEQQQMLQDAVGPVQPKHIVVHCTHGFNRTGHPSPFGSSCDSTVAKSCIVYLRPTQTLRQALARICLCNKKGGRTVLNSFKACEALIDSQQQFLNLQDLCLQIGWSGMRISQRLRLSAPLQASVHQGSTRRTICRRSSAIIMRNGRKSAHRFV